MHLVAHQPQSAALREHVAMMWFCERPDASGAEIVSPTGRAQMVIPIAEGSNAPALAGVYTRPQPIDVADQRRACGVVFRVGHTGAFIRTPLSEFTDAQPEVDRSFWSGELSLAERLSDAHAPKIVFETLERILLDSLIDNWSVDREVAVAVQMLDHGFPVGEVISVLGVDRRTFGHRFTQLVGVRPKQFSSTRRVQRAVREIRRAGDVPLAQLAVELGYSDQAHLTREFRRFTGGTPRSAHGIESSSPGHFAPM